MTKAQKVKWIEALRSGKYEQGFNVLCTTDNGKYCCLGVYGRAVLGVPGERLWHTGWPGEAGFRVSEPNVSRALAELNDFDTVEDGLIPVPFEVIAGVIDQWVETDD